MASSAAQRLSSEIIVTMVLGEQNTASMDPSVLDRVLSITEYVEVPPDTTLFTEGQPHEFVYLMVKGRVRLDRAGKPPLVYGRPGDFGSFDLSEDRLMTRTAVTLEESHFIRTRLDSLLELFEDAFTFAQRVLVTALARIHGLFDMVEAEVRFPDGEPPETVPMPEGELDLVERLLFMMDVAALRKAGVQTLVELATLTEQCALSEGERLYSPGARWDFVYAVADGELVTTHDDRGTKLHFRRGSIVNWGPGLVHSSPKWQTHAVRPTRLLGFRLADWRDAMEEHFPLFISTLSAVAEDQERMLTQLSETREELIFE